MTLNLACGNNSIKGCINVDKFVDKCDIKCDITNLPFKDGSVDTVFLFHAIEHFEELKQIDLLKHIWQKLKPEGRLVLSYPEFTKCAQNYINNYKGMRDFWKATIYGRQLNPGDYHYTLMDSVFFKDLLAQLGYKNITVQPEPNEPYNTVVKCQKGNLPITQEALYRKIIWNI